MDLINLSQQELQERCAWCHRVMPEDEECFGTGLKMTPEGKHLIKGREGTLVVVPGPEGHQIIVIVPTKDSEARKAGHDLYVQACSEACCDKLTGAFRG